MAELDQFLISLNYIDDNSPLSIPDSHNVHIRSNFANSFHKFKNGTGNVVFMGGSITEGNGYRVMVSDWLQQRFPDCKFTFTNAGISSTCSTTGAFRLQQDVLSKGPVDLFFVEFAVNDNQDAAHAKRECLRGMEGILRHVRHASPDTDIVVTHFINPPMLEMLQSGKEPISSAQHETAALHYKANSVHLARDVAQQITSGKMTWKDYGGTHPKPFGHQHCANLIVDCLKTSWKNGAQETPGSYELPKPLDTGSYADGDFKNVTTAKIQSDWTVDVPDWANISGGKRSRFTSIPMLSATTPGATLTLNFTGRAIGAYIVAGPDAGILQATIDDGAPADVDLYHRFSKGLHYPRTVMFATDLKSGQHTLTLTVQPHHNKSSKGTAARIMWFTVNN